MVRRLLKTILAVAIAAFLAIAGWIWWAGRDEVLTSSSAYGFSIGMTKAEVLDTIHAQGRGNFMKTALGPDSRQVPDDLRPGGPLMQSDFWIHARAGVPVDRHEFYFKDGRLKKMITKKRLFETP